jgi:L-alanine-DL-glutamate epimerase-like enolase superfamily enzyme
MARVISVEAERFPIAGTFTISRGSKTEAEVITVTIHEDGQSGRGECVPYKRYGETMDGVRDAIEAMRGEIAAASAGPRCSMPCAPEPPAMPSTARYGT